MSDSPDVSELELSDDEEDALHELQLAVEHTNRAHGELLAFHHEIGAAFDRLAAAEELLRETGHGGWADDIRDDILPAGIIEGHWTYELVEAFENGTLERIDALQERAREDVADGVDHVGERQLQRRWRERAEGWSPE